MVESVDDPSEVAVLDGAILNRPAVVALGGGHGLSVALQAARRYAGSITAVVSVADDGGSSGRLRRDLDVPAPGDLRKCLVALAGEGSPWAAVLEHRFRSGELEGHALGNLLIVGLTEALGDLPTALREAGRLVDAVGRVLPATVDPVVIKADVDGEVVQGQVAVSAAGARGRIRGLHLVPRDVVACPDAVDAIAHADQILVGPGSLYTSLLAVLVVPEIRLALALARGRIVQIANLRTETPETEGLDGTDHALALLEHRARVDTFLYDTGGPLVVNDAYL
ncbi:MAG: hypothetical protein QOH10_1981, partial [Actinomycetota bacterium]|nr:hypothetical protein [Actinomycetota bacterium]